LGKPSSDLALIALERLGCRPEEVLVVGDRMDTDILFAKNAGLGSVLVLTGATTRDDIAQYDYKPDYIMDHIADFEQVLQFESHT
jgi:ribonucleotide monophosphatase NagD (HAD superfamily)